MDFVFHKRLFRNMLPPRHDSGLPLLVVSELAGAGNASVGLPASAVEMFEAREGCEFDSRTLHFYGAARRHQKPTVTWLATAAGSIPASGS